MFTRLLTASLLCAFLLAGAAIAQQEAATETPQVQPVPEAAETQPAAAAMPKAEPVLEHIPADAIAFVVVNDVGAMAADVDKYLADVGLAPLLADKMPNGLLDVIKSALMLGEGFNPNGGFAAAMLPLDKYGVDLDELMKQHRGKGAEEQPASAPAEQQKLPLLVLVPGSGVQEVFGNYQQSPAGKYTEVSLRMGKMLATQTGGYVALSPRADVLDSLASLDKNIASKLNSDQAEFVARSLIAFHADFAAASGTMDKVFKKLQEIVASQEGGARTKVARGLEPMILMQQEILSQLETLTAGVRLAETGLVGEAMISYKPDSEIGKAMASVTPPAVPPLNRLPNLPYVLAYGAGAQGNTLRQVKQNTAIDMLDKMMSSGAFPKMDAETVGALKELIGLLNEECTEIQLVAGGAPEGSGLVALGCVIGCNDSAKVKDAIVDKVPPLINRLIEKAAKKSQREPSDVKEPASSELPQTDPAQEGTGAAPAVQPAEAEKVSQPAEAQAATAPAEAVTAPETAETEPATAPAQENVKLVVMKAAESIDNVPVDVVEITLPAEAREQAAQQLATVLGEDKLRIFIVAPDDKTVVMTFGGAKAFLAEAVKTAKAADGNILASEGAEEAMKHMPKNAMVLGFYNIGNLFELIGKIAAAISPGQGQGPALPFQVTTKTPIAFGAGVTGATQHMVFYVPTDLVKEVSGIVAMFMGRMRHPPQGSAGEQNF